MEASCTEKEFQFISKTFGGCVQDMKQKTCLLRLNLDKITIVKSVMSDWNQLQSVGKLWDLLEKQGVFNPSICSYQFII